MTDGDWMGVALAVGRRALGHTGDRPPVGCALVREGRLLARGWTEGMEGAHAEAAALAKADARGATAYVTLEPCSHHGRTPPCADALVAAGIARAVVALEDPNPKVAGRGLERLRAAGIPVTVGTRAAEAEETLKGFLSRMRRGRPWLTLKLAVSLDGRIATATGESRWITGPEARAHVHLLRAQHDAVLVGGGTARADDPALDTRLAGLPTQAAVVAARDGDVPPRLATAAAAAARTVWLVSPAAPPPGVRHLAADPHDAPAMLAGLAEAGINAVLCEGGGRLAASLIAAGLVDELVLMQAGLALGAEGRPALGPLPALPLTEAARWRLVAQRRLGPDLMSRWRPA